MAMALEPWPGAGPALRLVLRVRLARSGTSRLTGQTVPRLPMPPGRRVRIRAKARLRAGTRLRAGRWLGLAAGRRLWAGLPGSVRFALIRPRFPAGRP